MFKSSSGWSDTYKSIFYAPPDASTQPLLWGKWVHANSQSMEVPVYSTGVLILQSAFPPVTIPSGTPDIAAEIISQAWFTYISSALFIPAPPAPPFSIIASLTINMDLLNPARLALKASLIAQFSATASGDAALDVKAKGIATAFYAASISLGVLVNGTSLPAPTTGPLVLPTAII